MICAGIKQNEVVAILKIDDEVEYQKFSGSFELLIDCSPYPYTPQIGWILEGDNFNWGQLNDKPSVKITKLAFRNRFNQAEKATIEAFSTQQNNYAYALKASMNDQRDATFIDLARQDTIIGVQGLVALGILTSGRANTILNTPPTYDETYKGQI